MHWFYHGANVRGRWFTPPPRYCLWPVIYPFKYVCGLPPNRCLFYVIYPRSLSYPNIIAVVYELTQAPLSVINWARTVVKFLEKIKQHGGNYNKNYNINDI